MGPLRIRYETGIATLVQFIVVTGLSFINSATSIVSGCIKSSTSECVSNSLVSLLIILLTAGWFGFVWVLGYAAQDRRSPRLAKILIAAEGMIAVVALFDARHYPNLLGLITSLIDAALALWVIVLAWRLNRARGARITRITTSAGRPRRRPLKPRAVIKS